MKCFSCQGEGYLVSFDSVTRQKFKDRCVVCDGRGQSSTWKNWVQLWKILREIPSILLASKAEERDWEKDWDEKVRKAKENTQWQKQYGQIPLSDNDGYCVHDLRECEHPQCFRLDLKVCQKCGNHFHHYSDQYEQGKMLLLRHDSIPSPAAP